jgi:hypothetical protein
MNVTDAHQSLKKFSNSNAGIGISIEIIQRIIADQIIRLNSRFSFLESNENFRPDLRVFFSGKFDTSLVYPKFENIENPRDSSEYFPVVNLNNLKVKLFGYLADKNNSFKKKVIEIEIDFTYILGKIFVEDRQLLINLFDNRHSISSFIKLWIDDHELRDFFEDINTYNFDNEDWDNLSIYFRATSIFSGSAIAESLIESIELPDIFQIFSGIKFGDEERIGADANGGLLMFSANSSLILNTCPIYNSEGQTYVKPPIVTTGQTPGDIVVETEIDNNSPTIQYPVGEDRTDQIRMGELFLYTPLKLLEHNFGIVKPSVTASDKGKYGPISWRYSVTAAVKSITLQLVKPWPIEFRLMVPFEVTGQAGAGVKIGCVRYEATGAMFDGEVDPFNILFKIYLDQPSRQIVFVSKIEKIKAVDFRFSTFPRLDFPISEVLDVILGKASEFVIKKQSGRILNITRIPIANLDLVSRVAEIQPNVLAGESDAEGNITMGIKLKL